MEENLENLISIRSKNGCHDALEILIKQNQTMVYSTAYYIAANKDAAHNISCEVFSQLYEAIGDYREHISLANWIYKLTIKNTLEFIGKKENRLGERSFGKSQRDKVIEAIQLLPEENRILVVLHDIQKLSYKEISIILDCSQDKVRISLQKARLAVKQILLTKKSSNRTYWTQPDALSTGSFQK